MQCNQSLCGISNCGQLSNCGQPPNCCQIPSLSQLVNCSQVPNYGQFSNCGQYNPCNPASQCNGSPYPQIVGEGEVTSLMLPDGSMQHYFQPTMKLCPPFIQNPNLRCYNNPYLNSNTAWLVRNVYSLNSVNPFGNAVPQPIFNQQSQFPFGGTPLPRPCFNCNSTIALPVQTLPPPCQLKFHNDGWTSTTDLTYFYPRVHSDVKSKACARVQVSVPAETVPPCHCDVVRTKICSCYQENTAAALNSRGDTKSKYICKCHSRCGEKKVASSQSYMSIDEAISEGKPSRQFNPKSEEKSRDIFCKCYPLRSKGIVIESSQSGMSIGEIKSKTSICKRTKKDKKKEICKRRAKSQENLCSCCSPTAATSSSRTSTKNKQKPKHEKNKKEKSERLELKGSKRMKKNKKKEQSQENLCSCILPNAATSNSLTSTENKQKPKREKKKKEKSERLELKGSKRMKKNKKKEQSQENLCSCCSSTAATSSSRTSTENKQEPKREKKKKVKKSNQLQSKGSKLKERSKKKDQSQENLSSCCSSNAATSSDRSSTVSKQKPKHETKKTEKRSNQSESKGNSQRSMCLKKNRSLGLFIRKPKQEKKTKQDKVKKGTGDCQCISQSESNNNSCIYVADEKHKLCNEYLTATSTTIEGKRKRKSTKEKKDKKRKQDHSRDQSQESSFCFTATSNSSLTSTERKHKRKRQKKNDRVNDYTSQSKSITIADNNLKSGEAISASSTWSKRRKLMKKHKKKNHVCEEPSSLESKESVCCIHAVKPIVNTNTSCSFGNIGNEIINDNICDCNMQVETSNKQVSTYTEQASGCIGGSSCESQIICDTLPIVENPMLKCVFSAVCSNSEVPSVNLSTSFNDTNIKTTEAELWFPTKSNLFLE